MIKNVYQGHDVPLDIVVRNSAGQIVRPSQTTGMIILLYYKVTGQILERFSLNSLPNYKSIEIIDDVAGRIRTTVQASTTRIAQIGDIYMELKYQMPSATLENGNVESGIKDVYVFTISESRLKNVTAY